MKCLNVLRMSPFPYVIERYHVCEGEILRKKVFCLLK